MGELNAMLGTVTRRLGERIAAGRRTLARVPTKAMLLLIAAVTAAALTAGLLLDLALIRQNRVVALRLEEEIARSVFLELRLDASQGAASAPLRLSRPLPDCAVLATDGDGNVRYASDGFPASLTFPAGALESGKEETEDGTLYFFRDGLSVYCYFPAEEPRGLSPSALFALMLAAALAGLALMMRQFYFPLTRMDAALTAVVSSSYTKKPPKLRSSLALGRVVANLELLLANFQQLTTKEANARLMKKQAEIDALQSQINPHFLYNTLDCIRGQAFQYGAQDIQTMTLALSKMFRYSISNHNTFVTLDEELNNINNYLMIQQIRFCNRFLVNKRVEADAARCKLPKLMIQPIVENAIHHGLEPKLGAGTLTISAYITDKRLVIDVTDDGVGIAPGKVEKLNYALTHNTSYVDEETQRVSVGLTNVNSRIKLCFGAEYGISIYSTPTMGSNVQISLPLQEEDGETAQ